MSITEDMQTKIIDKIRNYLNMFGIKNIISIDDEHDVLRQNVSSRLYQGSDEGFLNENIESYLSERGQQKDYEKYEEFLDNYDLKTFRDVFNFKVVDSESHRDMKQLILKHIDVKRDKSELEILNTFVEMLNNGENYFTLTTYSSKDDIPSFEVASLYFIDKDLSKGLFSPMQTSNITKDDVIFDTIFSIFSNSKTNNLFVIYSHSELNDFESQASKNNYMLKKMKESNNYNSYINYPELNELHAIKMSYSLHPIKKVKNLDDLLISLNDKIEDVAISLPVTKLIEQRLNEDINAYINLHNYPIERYKEFIEDSLVEGSDGYSMLNKFLKSYKKNSYEKNADNSKIVKGIINDYFLYHQDCMVNEKRLNDETEYSNFTKSVNLNRYNRLVNSETITKSYIDYTINKKYMEIYPGDIFKRGSDYFIYIGRSCDSIIRFDKKVDTPKKNDNKVLLQRLTKVSLDSIKQLKEEIEELTNELNIIKGINKENKFVFNKEYTTINNLERIIEINEQLNKKNNSLQKKESDKKILFEYNSNRYFLSRIGEVLAVDSFELDLCSLNDKGINTQTPDTDVYKYKSYQAKLYYEKQQESSINQSFKKTERVGRLNFRKFVKFFMEQTHYLTVPGEDVPL